ncbi:uncharacterized protein C8Q71DRAFT_857983 [Rhodofomes roseus]|uniref:SnoaL-like domain-containing protein n=1 Tax=Rhodofomes roseus TaxID=34475 RepID=A0ABQ8KHK4_9APHY|nr:uncharacterized protein C8Q71DRAFT_857983 [Rhodofomes roseus]KAH9836779.1 hypothetical protein C8Q71DRAFT_857983 [Rhodofomes roseus]
MATQRAERYDPNSPLEQEVKLPSAPRVALATNATLQPPLTRRGTGPGLIQFLPARAKYASSTTLEGEHAVETSLDPEPVQKWAEEGYAVVAVEDAGASGAAWGVTVTLTEGLKALKALTELDVRDRFGVIVYDPDLIDAVHDAAAQHPEIVAIVAFTDTVEHVKLPKPTQYHLPGRTAIPDTGTAEVVTHEHATSPFFVFVQSGAYEPSAATAAHSKSLVFLRKHIGGPHFDIEAIWEEHTYFEFEVRSVAKTMGTMVQEPYVNHVPTMTGGVGREALTTFYRDHFIFSNPPDAALKTVSRTVGADRVVDEFIFHVTHTTMIDWLLPGVPPTGKKLEIPMLGVINVRGDRLYHEHIWWDQGTVLKQAGLLPDVVTVPTSTGPRKLKLPVAGVEAARMLVNESDGKSNEMFGWGYQD